MNTQNQPGMQGAGFCWALTLGVCLMLSQAARAQTPGTQNGSSHPWEILDNSFLVEEAFNQERGIVQNIFAWTHDGTGNWNASFTQEWPLLVSRHQLSYTLPISGNPRVRGFNDVLINYRYQLLEESSHRPAVSPRISVILPIGDRSAGFGDGTTGIQLNVPVSKQWGNLYLHGNAGSTWFPGADVTSPFIAWSGIWRAAPMFNVMLETTLVFHDLDQGDDVGRERILTLSPGFRTGWNFGDHQLIVGLALPVTRIAGTNRVAGLGYVSYELPFR